MPRYIDISILDDEQRSSFKTLGNFDILYGWLDFQPSVDAVEVVRCKDCVHRHQTTCPFLIANAYKTSSDDDFCSRAERRDNE